MGRKQLEVFAYFAQDDGTDIEFRNVGFYTSDAGEIPKRTQTTFWTRRKSKNYQFTTTFDIQIE